MMNTRTARAADAVRYAHGSWRMLSQASAVKRRSSWGSRLYGTRFSRTASIVRQPGGLAWAVERAGWRLANVREWLTTKAARESTTGVCSSRSVIFPDHWRGTLSQDPSRNRSVAALSSTATDVVASATSAGGFRLSAISEAAR